MKDVHLIRKACPLCEGELKGNDDLKYFCANCNMLFDRTHVNMLEERRLKKERQKTQLEEMKKRLEKEEPAIRSSAVEKTEPKQPQKTQPSPIQEETEQQDDYALETQDTLIASEKSYKLHHGQCHFVSKIHKANRIYVKSIEEGKTKGYQPCVCLRRIGRS